MTANYDNGIYLPALMLKMKNNEIVNIKKNEKCVLAKIDSFEFVCKENKTFQKSKN
jgi:hypothetical protein